MNNVSFASNAGVYDRPNFAKPQAYSRQSMAYSQPPVTPESPKKGKAGKVILGTLAAIAVTAGLLVAGNKTGVLKNLGKYVPESVKNAKFLQFAKEPVKVAAGALDTAGKFIADNAVKGYEAVKGYGETAVDTVKGWFGKGAPATPPAP